MTTVTLELTTEEANALREKLAILMAEAKGVDIWLNDTGEDGTKECFLDCDEEAHCRLGTILEKLGGDFQPHRTEGFSDLGIGNMEALIDPTYLWVVFQRSETKPIEELPITGIYTSRELATKAAIQYLQATDGRPTKPALIDEFESIFYFANGEAECVVHRMVLDH